MSLVAKQHKFACMVSELLRQIAELGYQVTLGEAWRTPEMAEIYFKRGIGIKDSKHCQRLAIDLNLFKDGKYLTKTEDYEIVGRIWESLGGIWGGRFLTIKDGNHFEL